MEIDYNDQKTWKLFQEGLTVGVFQCESKLVQEWLKRIKPTNIWELSAVIAAVRPGPLKSSYSDDYVAYRNGEKKYEPIHPDVDDIFKVTEGVLLYQEQLMQLGARLAWPDLDEMDRLIHVDKLRKGVGKKDQKKLVAIGKEFVEGCVKNNVDKEIADNLFEVIKNCGRYLFNLSHSIEYAYVSYETAYLKTHYPEKFYCTYFSYAKFKLKKWIEIKRLSNECQIFGIQLVKPNFNKRNANFMHEGKTIYYGLSHIKFFGGNTLDKIRHVPPITHWTHVLKLCFSDFYGKKLTSNPSNALIRTGAFSDTGITRTTLLNMYEMMDSLSDKELDFVIGCLEDDAEPEDLRTILITCAEEISVKARKKTMLEMAQLLELDTFDHPQWISEIEEEYLGVPITSTAIDLKDIEVKDRCGDLLKGTFEKWHKAEVAGVISRVQIKKIKNGPNTGKLMAVMDISDGTGVIEHVPIFSAKYENLTHLIRESNTLYIKLAYADRGWIIDDVKQI